MRAVEKPEPIESLDWSDPRKCPSNSPITPVGRSKSSQSKVSKDRRFQVAMCAATLTFESCHLMVGADSLRGDLRLLCFNDHDHLGSS